MATRVSSDSNLSGQSLIRQLRKKAGKREGLSYFSGLKRSEALSDVADPVKSLASVLRNISTTETEENEKYSGPYSSVDWSVTSDFIPERINKDFLSRLSGASIGGGSLGSIVSKTPRIRIQDRISFLDSFYGNGSYPGLHSGPDAQFYKAPEPLHVGYIKFTFDSISRVVTTSEVKDIDSTTNVALSSLLGNQDAIVLTLSEYEFNGVTIQLVGSGISLRLVSPNSWSVEDVSIPNLVSVRNIVRNANFQNVRFKLVREYSRYFLPKWYNQMPGDAQIASSGGADDNDPVTSPKILSNGPNGQILPYIERGYWFTGGYVETRWSGTEAYLVTGEGRNTNPVVQDSNMRWLDPPRKLRLNRFNWGIRWDGYLRMTPGIYALQVQTNTLVRIDMAIGSGNTWVNIFDTRTAARESEQTYISNATFNTDNVNNLYKYFTGDNASTDWIAYIPITIRMFHGSSDSARPEELVSTEPNLFIKTTTLSSAKTFYSEEHTVTLTGSNNVWGVTGSNLSRIIQILQDTNASVIFALTAKNNQIFTSNVIITLSTNGTTVSGTTTGTEFTSGTYTLTVFTNRPQEFNDNLSALFKSRIVSPSVTYVSYSDLTDGSYEPNPQKLPFDSRPDWWKVSEGHPYDRSETISDNNDPLDGFFPNSFQDILKSRAPNIGLYGNGSGVFSSKPNIILGEVRYDSSDPKGSNYAGIRLIPNRLGEGGHLAVNSLPVNNAVFNDSTLLGPNDLGGGTNHLTAAEGKITPRVIRLFLHEPTPADSNSGKYFLHVNISSVSASDNPVTYGLPGINDALWLSPLTISAVRLADNTLLTENIKNFVSPLTINVELVVVNNSGTPYTLLAFSTNLASINLNGSEKEQFSGKYIEYYTESDIAFQYRNVDTGESISFSDVLKLTYGVNNTFNGSASEVPRPASDRVTPFGFDKPEYSSGICYPPYAINNTLLNSIAIEDNGLYQEPAGNYDVFWGNPTQTDLENKTLTVTEKLEFQNIGGGSSVVQPVSSISIPFESYSHRLKIDMPPQLPPQLSGSFDEDMLVHIGNEENVKESYYAFVKL